jgi:hypothetical protein
MARLCTYTMEDLKNIGWSSFLVVKNKHLVDLGGDILSGR